MYKIDKSRLNELGSSDFLIICENDRGLGIQMTYNYDKFPKISKILMMWILKRFIVKDYDLWIAQLVPVDLDEYDETTNTLWGPKNGEPFWYVPLTVDRARQDPTKQYYISV